MKKFNIEKNTIEELANILNEKNLTEIEIKHAEYHVRIVRQYLIPSASDTSISTSDTSISTSSTSTSIPTPNILTVKSPMVGIVYLSPEPKSSPFVSIGSNIEKGQTLMLIEAMKTFNPIRSPKSGKITKILINDGNPVEYDEPLIIIE